MKDISHKKIWLYGEFHIIVYPPHIPIIKSDIDQKSEEYYVKIKLRRNNKSDKSLFLSNLPLFPPILLLVR